MNADSTPPFASATGATTAATGPVQKSRNDWPGRLLAGAAGVVLGGVIVGAAWLATSGQGGDYDGRTAKITVPDKIGVYPKFANAKINQQAKAKPVVERTNAWNAESAKRLSASFGGATAAIESYSDDAYENSFTLYVVRATSQFPLYVRYEDPKVTQLVRPQNEEIRFGEVSCHVTNDPTPAGQQPEPDSMHVFDCRRTKPGLTIDITYVSGDLGNRPDQVAALVNEVWSQLS